MSVMQNLTQIVLGTAGTLLALGAIWRVVRACYRLASYVEHMQRVVTKELVPNGGGSMIDAVNRIDRILGEHETRFERIDAAVIKAAGRVEAAAVVATAKVEAAAVAAANTNK